MYLGTDTTVNGPGGSVIGAGSTVYATNVTFNSAVENDGTLVVEGPSNAINRTC